MTCKLHRSMLDAFDIAEKISKKKYILCASKIELKKF